MTGVDPLPDAELAEKVAYLRRPDSYPDSPEHVEVIETHFAWIFLCRRYVYKLKKPIRFPGLNLSTPEARRVNCNLELALNRRLAPDTYVDVVALGRRDANYCLELSSNPADWLVKMVRLPGDVTLENQLSSMRTDDPQLAKLIDTLCGFYRRTKRSSWDVERYSTVLVRQCGQCARRLMRPDLEAEQTRVQKIAERQRDFVAKESALLETRIAEGRVCDAHGDLRPEHIFLTENPQIIDCLEFSEELRQLDTAEEISFLALECERLGRGDIGEQLRALYIAGCSDPAPRRLFDYYRSRRAIVRAFLSAWHVDEGFAESSARRWLDQARWYIAAAEASIAAAMRNAPASENEP